MGESHQSREATIAAHGYTTERLALMAKLGIVYAGFPETSVDGVTSRTISFTFIPNSPMGRINRVAGHEDRDLMDQAIADAKALEEAEFKSKYLSFGPYED